MEYTTLLYRYFDIEIITIMLIVTNCVLLPFYRNEINFTFSFIFTGMYNIRINFSKSV